MQLTYLIKSTYMICAYFHLFIRYLFLYLFVTPLLFIVQFKFK